ncbi:MAG: 5-oxoprolinase subunit PxpB [Chloroflexota bacterium]|nr:5-oxoprolinase subunit PxpB [Chloroflexota bacterium]
MNAWDKTYPRYLKVGELALLLELAEEMTPTVNAWVRAVDVRMGEIPMAGVIEWIPAYASLLIKYDPIKTNSSDVQRWLKGCLESAAVDAPGKVRCVQIPVHYGGQDGPDLEAVAAFHSLSSSEVVARHTRVRYHVGMMGFTPGFAYLMGLEPSIATPRHETPRILVPAGSVGIAGMQTGIYPLDSPGGWQLIGRTDKTLFNPDQEPPFLLLPGDKVQFVASKDGDVT